MGIHYVLCNKLRQFPYEDIEFFLPQLCHLIISVNNESMALEGFLLDLCEDSVTAALLVGLTLTLSLPGPGPTLKLTAPLPDLLALPDVSARPLLQPPDRFFSDLSPRL